MCINHQQIKQVGLYLVGMVINISAIPHSQTDVATILKCHAIVAEMLEVLSLTSVSPTLQMLIESLVSVQ